jgi:hypothetical protein
MNQDYPSAPAPAPLPEEPKKSTNTWLIVGIVAVVLCCCCLIAAGVYAAWTYGDQWLGTGMLSRQASQFIHMIG